MRLKTLYSLSVTMVAALMLLSIPTRATETDRQIELSARRSYVFKTYLKGDDIRIETRDGAVTLRGSVAEDSHRSMAEITITNIAGVKSVDNQLVTLADPSGSGSDAWLSERVRNTMLLHRDVNYAYSGVSVSDGNVTLRGLASSEDQRQLTTQYAMAVSGVKSVDNKMTVSHSLAHPPRSEDVTMDDASIATQVSMSLLILYGTLSPAVHISAHGGIVILAGSVHDQTEKNNLKLRVSEVNGVKGVDNRLMIEPSGVLSY
jgi:hyperosmotically inducible protein